MRYDTKSVRAESLVPGDRVLGGRVLGGTVLGGTVRKVDLVTVFVKERAHHREVMAVLETPAGNKVYRRWHSREVIWVDDSEEVNDA